jgi:hypothetical protein
MVVVSFTEEWSWWFHLVRRAGETTTEKHPARQHD